MKVLEDPWREEEGIMNLKGIQKLPEEPFDDEEELRDILELKENCGTTFSMKGFDISRYVFEEV